MHSLMGKNKSEPMIIDKSMVVPALITTPDKIPQHGELCMVMYIKFLRNSSQVPPPSFFCPSVYCTSCDPFFIRKTVLALAILCRVYCTSHSPFFVWKTALTLAILCTMSWTIHSPSFVWKAALAAARPSYGISLKPFLYMS